MKRYGNLWKDIIDEDNLFLAARKAMRDKCRIEKKFENFDVL